MRPQDGAGWVARMHARRLSIWDRRAVRVWLAASPEHARDLLRAETVWRLSGALGADPELQAELAPFTAAVAPKAIAPKAVLRSVSWRWAAASMAVLAITTLVWLAMSVRADEYETAPGEQRTVSLADGSTLALNTATRVKIEFSPQERRVVLTRGEALFDVAHEAARPFIVRAGAGSVRAVGTRFNVLMDQQTVTVSVLEGRVELAPRAQAPSPAVLTAGESAAWETSGRLVAAAPERASQERIAAWREGKLRFDAWPLARAIEEHNRYAKRPIRLGDDVSGEVAVSGVFRIGDTEALIEALNQLMDIQAIDAGETWVLVGAKESAR